MTHPKTPINIIKATEVSILFLISLVSYLVTGQTSADAANPPSQVLHRNIPIQPKGNLRIVSELVDQVLKHFTEYMVDIDGCTDRG